MSGGMFLWLAVWLLSAEDCRTLLAPGDQYGCCAVALHRMVQAP